MEKELCDNEFTTSMENEEDDVTEIKECMENGEVLKDPEVGMEFGTLDEYMEYFSNYGYQKGFPVKIRSTERGANGVVKFVILACARSGTSRIQSKNLFKLKSVSKTGCKVYNVTEDMFGGTTRRATFSVCFKEGFCDIRCNCLLFEFRGILCKHALTVLLQKQVHTLPEKFFLRRWRKDVKRHHKKIKIIYADWTVNPENERFDKMCKAFYEVADLAAVDEDKINVVICWTKRLLNEINLNDGTRESDNCTPKVGTYVHSGNSGPSAKESVSVGRPLAVHHKGISLQGPSVRDFAPGPFLEGPNVIGFLHGTNAQEQNVGRNFHLSTNFREQKVRDLRLGAYCGGMITNHFAEVMDVIPKYKQ
ncbi:hypothetical protein IFM89_013082 [Coptis chinensis]|uniref:Protein FAR1-RELATED SEQUENCE n=1 Tax=Coptis chinensis TaxID=261450 RepID=A0A835LQ81_9MAGN|nr:hypothetical protein IFM89_013082 [Coptis chinensis]